MKKNDFVGLIEEANTKGESTMNIEKNANEVAGTLDDFLTDTLTAIDELTYTVITLFSARARDIVIKEHTGELDHETAQEYLDDEHGKASDIIEELTRYKNRVSRYTI